MFYKGVAGLAGHSKHQEKYFPTLYGETYRIPGAFLFMDMQYSRMMLSCMGWVNFMPWTVG